jgi:predicted DNA-binding protein
MSKKYKSPLSFRLKTPLEARLKAIIAERNMPLNRFVVDAIERRVAEIERDRAAA